MPIVHNTNQEEYNSGLSTLEDVSAALETVSTGAAFLPNPIASIAGNIGASASGIVKDAARYFNNKQSGLTTLANISNHIGWGLLGIIPYSRALKGVRTVDKSKKAIAKAVGLGVGRSASAGALTYGLPGVEQHIREEGSFTPRGVAQGLFGNGLTLLGEDILNIPDNWAAASRVAGTFILPNTPVGRLAPKGVKKVVQNQKKNINSKQPQSENRKMLENKDNIAIPGGTMTTKGEVKSPKTHFKRNKQGGKLNKLKSLRQ